MSRDYKMSLNVISKGSCLLQFAYFIRFIAGKGFRISIQIDIWLGDLMNFLLFFKFLSTLNCTIDEKCYYFENSALTTSKSFYLFSQCFHKHLNLIFFIFLPKFRFSMVFWYFNFSVSLYGCRSNELSTLLQVWNSLTVLWVRNSVILKIVPWLPLRVRLVKQFQTAPFSKNNFFKLPP